MIIERFHSNYIIQKGKINPTTVQNKLDRIAGNLLEKEIHLTLSQVLHDNSVLYFIRKIKVDLGLNLAKLNDRAIAKLWAKKITSSIIHLLQSADRPYLEPYKDLNVAIFQNRAVYLTNFIQDLLIGRAWDKWYFQEFKYLSPLPKKEIIKLIFKQHREIIEEIFMVSVEMGTLDKILEELAEEDIKAIYSHYLGESLRKDFDSIIKTESRDYIKIVQFISGIIRNGQIDISADLPQSYKVCLKVYLLALKKYPEFKPEASLKGAIEDVIFHKRERLLTTKPEELDIVDTPEEISTPDVSKKIITPYGGLFLLIPSILEIKLNDIINQSSFPEEVNISPLNYFLFFLALKICNQKISGHSNIDPGLLLFAGLEKRVSFKNLVNYAETTTSSMNEEFLKSLIKALDILKEQKASWLDYMDLNAYLNMNIHNIDYETVVSLAAELILKVFSRRLRGMERSSSIYIFNNFLFRPSEIQIERDLIHIILSKKPLDIVLRLSGLIDDTYQVSWLNNKKIKFSLGEVHE